MRPTKLCTLSSSTMRAMISQVLPNHHGELLQEIRSVGSQGLRHVEVREGA